VKPSLIFRIALALVIGTCAVAAHADSIVDPTIIIRDPACSGNCTPVGLNFTFGTPADGTGVVLFNNASGLDWFSLSLSESGVDAAAITCLTDAFVNCSVSTVNGLTTILLSGLGPDFAGIPAGHNFSIVFGCESGDCQPWPGDLDFTARANVPEPGTMALLFTGIGAIVARRKLRNRV
jgi:hypothetical protein